MIDRSSYLFRHIQLVLPSWSVPVYEYTNLRIATETRPIFNSLGLPLKHSLLFGFYRGSVVGIASFVLSPLSYPRVIWRPSYTPSVSKTVSRHYLETPQELPTLTHTSACHILTWALTVAPFQSRAIAPNVVRVPVCQSSMVVYPDW